MSDEATNGGIDLRELLSKPTGDYPDMPELPGNKYFYGKITGVSAGTSSKQGTPYFRINVRLTDPGRDVSAEELDAMKKAGVTLGDYQVYADMWLTKNSMRMFRRFLDSLGFPNNVRVDEMLKLDPGTLNPTSETQDLFRGRDVICRTQGKNADGRVYNNLQSIQGVKRD